MPGCVMPVFFYLRASLFEFVGVLSFMSRLMAWKLELVLSMSGEMDGTEVAIGSLLQ